MDTQSEDVSEESIGAVGGVCSNDINKETTDTNFKCEPCLLDSLEIKATAFCVDCYKHICNNCALDHRRNKILRNHKILEGEGVSEQLKAINDLKKMMTCPDHQNLVFTLKCEDHNAFICIECLAQTHRKCNEVKPIQHLPTFGKADLCDAVKESLSQLHEDTVTSIKKTEENKEHLRTTLASVKTEQENVFDKIYELLSNTEEKLEMETSRLFKKELDDLERNSQYYQDAEEEETQYQRLLEVAERFGNANELTVIPDVISQKANQLKETIECKQQKDPPCLMFDCCMDYNALTNVGKVFVLSSENANQSEICDKHNLTSEENLTSMKTTNDSFKISTEDSSLQCSASKYLDTSAKQLEYKCFSTEQNEGSTPDTEQKPKFPSLMKRNVNPRGIAYPARCEDDTSACAIYSIVILQNKRLVCLDHNNMKLKVFNEDFSLSYAHDLQEKPKDMCHVSDTTVAVIFYRVREVRKYLIDRCNASSEGNFQVSSRFRIKALANFRNEEKVAILLFEEHGLNGKGILVQIRNADSGRLLKTFDFEKHVIDQFDFTTGLTNRLVCRGKNEIFVSEVGKLHCFDIENDSDPYQNAGRRRIQESWVSEYRKGDVLKNVTDLAVDDEGNIYVSCESMNVHQIAGPENSETRILVTDIQDPFSISVNDKNGYLIVACDEDDYLHVFNFS